MPAAEPRSLPAGDGDRRESPTFDLAASLIARRSITPDDADCQALVRERLEPLGFVCETMHVGDVTNLWARRGRERPVGCLAGQTDVVPTGPNFVTKAGAAKAIELAKRSIR